MRQQPFNPFVRLLKLGVINIDMIQRVWFYIYYQVRNPFNVDLLNNPL